MSPRELFIVAKENLLPEEVYENSEKRPVLDPTFI